MEGEDTRCGQGARGDGYDPSVIILVRDHDRVPAMYPGKVSDLEWRFVDGKIRWVVADQCEALLISLPQNCLLSF